MELELLDYSIGAIEWGDRSRLDGKSLFIRLTDVQEMIKGLTHGIRIDCELARPGESKRIVHVLDTVRPMVKTSGPGSSYPGFDGPAELVGTGQTTRIANLLVTVIGRFPQQIDNVRDVRAVGGRRRPRCARTGEETVSPGRSPGEGDPAPRPGRRGRS